MVNDNQESDNQAVDSQWYIRDRSCISKIDGLPEEVLEWMTLRDDLWKNFRSYRRKRRILDFDSPPLILFKALIDVGTLTQDHIQKVNKIKEIINRPSTDIDPQFRSHFNLFLQEVEKCEGKSVDHLEQYIEQYKYQCRYINLPSIAQEVKERCQ